MADRYFVSQPIEGKRVTLGDSEAHHLARVMRAQPGTDQQVVVVLKQGDTVMVFNDARLIHGATWVKVRAGWAIDPDTTDSVVMIKQELDKIK